MTVAVNDAAMDAFWAYYNNNAKQIEDRVSGPLYHISTFLAFILTIFSRAGF